MALFAYLVLTLVTLELASRLLTPISWRDRSVLGLLPLIESGLPLARGEVLGPIDLAWMRAPLASLREAAGVSLHSPVILYDQWCQIIPWRQAVRASLQAGEWPLWNPFVLSGEPLVGVISPAVFHPLNLLSLLLPAPQAITFVAAGTLLLSALWMYLLNRDLGVSPEAALFAGGAWAYGAFHLFWLGWPVALSASSVPLLILAARRVARRPGLASVATLASAWMLLFFGGSPEVALPGGLLAGALFVGQWTLNCPDRRMALFAVGSGTVLGLALSAIQLLPFLEALPQTAELAARIENDGAGLVPADRSTSATLLTEHLVPFALGVDPPGERVPRSIEPARATSWIGAVGLAAGLYGFVSAQSRWRWLLAAAVLGGVAFSIYLAEAISIAKALPGLSLLRPRFGVLWSSCAGTVLAGLGLEAALRAPRRRGFLFALLAAAAAIAASYAMAAGQLTERGVPPAEQWPSLTASALALAATALAVGMRQRAAVVVALALAGTLVERQIQMGGYYRGFPVEQFYPAVPPLAELMKRREEGRFVALGRATLHPNTATMWGLEDVRGYDPMALRRLVETYPIWAPGSPRQISRLATLHPFLSLLGVRFALSTSRVELLPGWSVRDEGPGWTLYENSQPLRRVFLPERVRIGGSSAARLADLAVRTDFEALAWIEPAEGSSQPREVANGRCRLTLETTAVGGRIAADCESEAWLATSIPAWRGWRAKTDDGLLPLGIANHAFLAVKIPSGKSDVTLSYLPSSFTIGASASGLGLLVCAALGWRGRRAKRL